MNVAKLFAINILIAVLFINLVGCELPKERIMAVQAICETDTDCEEFAPYFDAIGMSATAEQVVALRNMCPNDANCLEGYLQQVDSDGTSPTAFQDALELKAACDADPEDKLDMQECP